MSVKKEKKVTSIAEYHKIINKVIYKWDLDRSTINPWFRGHEDINWDLIPKIYRSSNAINNCERELTRDFTLYSPQYISHHPNNMFEWLFIMQHHGLATRLLDWTESSLVALYFAVNNYKYPNDSSVWILNPWSLNQDTLDMKSIPVYTNDVCEEYILNIETFEREVNVNYPMAFRPEKNSLRIVAQKGVFTIHGRKRIPINSLRLLQPNEFQNLQLFKIEINKNYKLKIKKELYFSGITDSALFPEIDGISRELTFRYSNDFMD
jgi:hypothetical protein